MKRYTSILYLAFIFTVFANPMRAENSGETQTDQNRKENALAFISSLQRRHIETKEETHVEVGTRSSHAEWILAQEEKAEAEQEHLNADKEEIMNLVNEDDAENTSEESTKEEVVARAYYTWHQGALHRPIAVTALGDIVTLEDGSEWVVKYSHRYKTLDWIASDSIIIFPNHAWFSSYYFRLVNQMTGADIEVNLFKGPIYNGAYSHWIIAIDYYNCEICLEDGTIWKVSSGEWSVLKKWLVNDTVIMGVNDSWFSSKPNILINVNMLNYVSAGPSHYDYQPIPITKP